MWPQDGASLGTRTIMWTHLVEVYYVMLHNKYKCLMPCVSDKKISPINSFSERVSSQVGPLIVPVPQIEYNW